MVAWPNGKALDYELRDSRFDPWCDHYNCVILLFMFEWETIEIFPQSVLSRLQTLLGVLIDGREV
jgi:hypothetical protein